MCDSVADNLVPDGRYWTRARLDETLGAAGFERIRWSAPELSPEAVQGPDPQQWQDFLDRPLCMVVECVRSMAT